MNTNNRKWIIFSVTGMANLVAAFSINSITLALPILANEFEAPQKTVGWLSLVYSLIPSCLLLILGRTAELYGYKRQFKAGFTLFGCVCAVTPLLAANMELLIFFRCLQGIGYAVMISITQAIVSMSFDASERGKAIGINTVFVSVGLAAGPAVGGFLLRYFSWRAIFYFNVPFCLIGYFITEIVLPDNFDNIPHNSKMDWLGAVLLAFSIGVSVIGLNYAGTGNATPIMLIGYILAAATGFLLLIIHERSTESPLIALELFKRRTFSIANSVSMLSYLVQQMTIYLTPFYLINVLMLPADRSGIIMLAPPALMMITSPFGGKLSDKKGTRLPAGLGIISFCLSCLMMSFLNGSTPSVIIVPVLMLMGAGNGLSISSINAAILNSASDGHLGVASGMLATMRNIGQTLGVVCGSVILSSRLSVYSVHYSESGAYLMAQRDAFRFGVLTLIIAFSLALSLRRN